MQYLIVVDMQNDFISMALGTKEAVSIVPRVKDKILGFAGKVIFTRDTHGEEYLSTQEGKKLPVVHCVKGTRGWEIEDSLKTLRCDAVFDKPTFGSVALMEYLVKENAKERVEAITLVGLCTDICVISNAMLIKAALPECEVLVDSACCAGVTPESHARALGAMASCQIQVI
ncbi:MAG: cysteine hydrolase [Clostridia bacterium]|nr:cysteine hydrolase [Clostridia bacterium]